MTSLRVCERVAQRRGEAFELWGEARVERAEVGVEHEITRGEVVAGGDLDGRDAERVRVALELGRARGARLDAHAAGAARVVEGAPRAARDDLGARAQLLADQPLGEELRELRRAREGGLVSSSLRLAERDERRRQLRGLRLARFARGGLRDVPRAGARLFEVRFCAPRGVLEDGAGARVRVDHRAGHPARRSRGLRRDVW
ncbi:MAG: hypothetical protein R3B36_11120 [Polyangiaceae bacterium]